MNHDDMNPLVDVGQGTSRRRYYDDEIDCFRAPTVILWVAIAMVIGVSAVACAIVRGL